MDDKKTQDVTGCRGIWNDKVSCACAYLLFAQILAAKGILQPLPDLLSRDGFEVGCLEDVVDDGGIALELFGGYYYQVVLFRGQVAREVGAKGCWAAYKGYS